jgi:hypothetical protein
MSADAHEPRSSRLDWQTVAIWTDEIVAGEPSELSAAFRARGARGPDIVWSPSVERMAAEPLRFLLRYWSELRAERPMPYAREIDPIEMRPALGYILLVDVLESGEDFRYRLFGSTIAGVSGFDMTGRRVSEHKASPYIVEFALAVYRAALRRPEPLLTEHGPPATLNTFAWHRLVLPLADENGTTGRFLVGNIPATRDGRPIALRL